MRKKQDPGIRQEAFIRAATELFMEKGFEAVSVRDILDAVADKSASPSVFYYYFSSKDALYRACVEAVAESYLAAMRSGFRMEGQTVAEWMLALTGSVEGYLSNEGALLLPGSSTPNRLFLLDMRDRVTRQVGALWAENLAACFGIPPAEAPPLAQFLSGGISEMIFPFMLAGRQEPRAVQALTERILRFCMNAVGLPAPQQAQLAEALRAVHGAGRSGQNGDTKTTIDKKDEA